MRLHDPIRLAWALLLLSLSALLLLFGVGILRAGNGPLDGPNPPPDRESIQCISARVGSAVYHLWLDNKGFRKEDRIGRNAALARLGHELERENLNRSNDAERRRFTDSQAIIQAATLDQAVCDKPGGNCWQYLGFGHYRWVSCSSSCFGGGCQVCLVPMQQ